MAIRNYQYLIIGGGMTAAAAVEGIRQLDASGSIGLISAEPDPPYNRPPLSKALWKGESLEKIWRDKVGDTATLHLDRRVISIEPHKKSAVDERGDRFAYDKLLLATGGQPRRLPFSGDDFIYFRTLADYRRLRAMTDEDKRFAVIGGGFIGTEIAAALAMNGKPVTTIFPGNHVGDRVFPAELARFLSGYYRDKSVKLIPGEKVIRAAKRGDKHLLTIQRDEEIIVDGVVVGIGIEPNVELGKAAGLNIQNGIVVDEFLKTSAPAIYAAGDVAAFRSSALAKRMRVEHEDNANTMGRAAGRNMAGAGEAYEHLPFFYSDLFEFGYEAVGEVDSRLETFVDWKEPNKQGVIYYLDHERLRGVLLWNVWGQDCARALIAQAGPFRPEDLRGRLSAEGDSTQ